MIPAWILPALLVSLVLQAALTWAAVIASKARQESDPGLGLAAFSALPALAIPLLPPIYRSGISPEEYVGIGSLAMIALLIVVPVAFAVAVFALLRKPRPWLGGWELAARVAAIPTLVLAWEGIVLVSPKA